jgi:hypothetical protein
MRQLVNIVAALTALLLAGGLIALKTRQYQGELEMERVGAEVRRFQQHIGLRSATKDVELNSRGFPTTIDPAWFEGDPPRNGLLSGDRPWVEVAPTDDAELTDPRIRIAVTPSLASFWYNPYQGVVRARVPCAINDRKALELYNRVNGTDLDSIFGHAAPVAAAAKPSADAVATGAIDPSHDDPKPEAKAVRPQ